MNTNGERATLYIVSTPIGNLEDISLRAMETLKNAEAVACEDTRHTRKIFSRYQIPLPRLLFSYHEHNEEQAGKKIKQLLAEGRSVALCSDAGTPGISDPGYRVISAALDAGYLIQVIPGPSAVTSALLVSGLPTSSFTFKGFPPRKKGPLRKFLAVDKEAAHTLIFFESPHRAAAFIKEAREVLGNRLAAVCMDLTKMYEEVLRGYLSELDELLSGRKIKGEVTIVIAGNNPKFSRENEKRK